MVDFTYGWTPDTPDQRDYKFRMAAHFVDPSGLPQQVDLRDRMPPIWQQGVIGSCVAQSAAAALQFLNPYFTASRLMIYYNARLIQGNEWFDSGCRIRDAIKTLSKEGVSEESLWPYIIDQYTVKPPNEAYVNGLNHKIMRYERLDSTHIDNVRAALAEGLPVIFGMGVYNLDSPEVVRSGVVTMPGITEKMKGGHAVLAVGYDHVAQTILVRNSWGIEFGKQGYFQLPYAYVTDLNLSDDYWIVRG